MTHRCGLALLASVLLGLHPSWVRAQPAPAAATPAPDTLTWPERVPPAASAPSAHGVIRPLEEVTLRPFHTRADLRPSDADHADAAALLGSGDNVEFERAGSFVYRVIPQAATEGQAPAAEHFVFISAQREHPDAPARLQRTWFACFPAATDQPRGTALLMPGMLGTPEPILDAFRRKLQERNWAVVRMMCQPSRFTERIRFDFDLSDPLRSVTPIAAELNSRVAEAAYAAEAAMRHVAQQIPSLRGKPRIAIGMSGGAMILPTVLAREPAAYAAAVAIAGGANFFALMDESNYKLLIGAVDLRWGPEPPTEQQRADIYGLYLEQARLDAFHTAAHLVGKPMLLIHGSFDSAVPSHLGDLLWERLGRPERWVQQAGHEEIFMRLPRQLDQIMDWLDAALEPLPGAAR